MKAIEDAKWRDAAAKLGLTLVRQDGRTVLVEKGTRRHRMRGTIEGHAVTADYGLRHVDDGVTVVDVRLPKPLLLGLCVQVSAPPRAGTGRTLGGGLRTSIEAVEPERARAMLSATASAKDLVSCLESLGSLGWVELRDTRVRIQCEVLIDTPDGYAKLVRVAVRTAVLAERARSALAPADWEIRLRTELEAVATDLRAPFDAALLRVVGESRPTDPAA
jgi:hypothetical protein